MTRPGATAPTARTVSRTARSNPLGILGVVSGTVALFSFRAAADTGKGGELIPLAVTLVAGAAATLLGLCGLAWRRRRGAERLSAAFATALGPCAIALLLVVWPSIARQRSGRQPCASNLRQIGQALLLYSMDHDGRIPDRLEDLITGTDALSATGLICPDGPDRPGQCSYDYIGAGRMLDDFGPDDIVAFEPPHNHQSDGGYALFGDGHIEYVYPAGKLRENIARVRQKLTTLPSTTQPSTDQSTREK